MNKGLRFALGGIAAGVIAMIGFTAETKEYYQPRPQSLEENSAAGSAAYFNRLRANPLTGKVEEADVQAARAQVQRLAKNAGASSLGLNWTEMGPSNMGGRTRAFIFDRDNPRIMYAGSVSGGIFKSTNAGRSWLPVDDQMSNLAITSMTQTANGDIYAGTGEDMYYFASGAGTGGILGNGIYKSTDGGNTFSLLPSTDPANNPNQGWTAVGKMGADPTNPNRVYAATSQGMKVSDDGGATWTDAGVGSSETLDLEVTHSGAVWVKSGQRIWKSDNGDAGTYNEITVSPAGADPETQILRSAVRMRMAISPNDDNYVYVITADGATGFSNFARAYQSKDGGQTWRVIGERSALVNPINLSPFAHTVGVDPKNPERILVAGLTVWEWSEQNGWFQIATNAQFANFYVHADNHMIKWRPDQPNTIWIANDGGLFKSVDDGFSWTEENKGYATIQFYKMAVGFDGRFTGGTQDNGTIEVDPNTPLPTNGVRTVGITQPSGATFDGDGGYTAISHLDDEVMFKSRQYGQMGRSINRGEEYSYFFNNRMSGRYNQFSFAFADFVTPYVLWEKLNDPNSQDSIAFKADTLTSALGFGNGGTRYEGRFTRPQSSTNFVASSFRAVAGSQQLVSDAAGVLSGDGTGSFDPVTGEYVLDFAVGTSVEIFVTVGTEYANGAIINITSKTGEIPLVDTLHNGLGSGQTAYLKDPVQSMFAVGLTAYDNASQPGNLGGGIWMARDVLQNRTATPNWWHIGNLSDGEVPSCMAFSDDGDMLFVGTNFGRVWRFSNLTNARSEESADVDIDFTQNPPAPSTSVIEPKVIYTAQGNRAITGVISDPWDSDRLIITMGNYGGSNLAHVVYTDQASSATLNSAGFAVKDGNLPNLPVYDAVFNYTDYSGKQVVIGTDLGVFTTDDITAANVTWTQENNQFANVPVFDLLQTQTIRYDLVNPQEDFEGAIYAATHGRGVFKTNDLANFVAIGLPEVDNDDLTIKDELKVYPNPASDFFNIELDLENRSNLKVSIYDLSGKQVKLMKFNGVAASTEQLSVRIDGLRPGTYLVNLEGGQNASAARLIVQ